MKRASTISIVYLIFGLAWIYLSDRLLFTNSANDPDFLWQISNSKGYVFVLISAAVLFFLIYQAFRSLHKQEQAAARELREKNVLINNTEDSIWSIDQGMKLRSCNEPFRRRIEEATGRNLRAGDSVILEEYEEKQLVIWQAYYERALAGEVIRETIHIDEKGESLYFHFSMHPLPDQERIIGVSCFAKDVTERELAQQQLKEREKLLASIFNSTSDAMGLAEIDQAGNITYVSANQTAKNLFLNQEMGITMDRYEGSGVQQFSTEVLKRSLEQGEQTEAYFRQVAGTQNSVSYETQYQLPNKPLLYIETTLNPILDEAGGCRYVLWVTRDITQQKITEQTIRASRNQLNQIYHATKEMMSLLKVEEGGQYRIESVNLPFLQMIQVDAPDTQLEDLEGIALFTGHENWGDQSWHQMFRDILPHLKTVCDQKEKLSFEWSQFQKGEVKAYEVCLIPILDQKPTLSRILVVLYDQTERLKETEQTLIAINKAVEEDRTRMARELHDSLTQTLSIVSMNLKNLSYDLPGLAEQAKYWKAMEYLEAGIEESRSLAHRIMPKSIRDFGLIPSIEELVEQTEHSHPITIHFSYNQAPRLNNETEINLFRLVQQALKNVLSHAEATEVGIGLCFEDNLLHLWIRDNGKGFNYEQKTKSFSGIGLRTMRSRVQQLGGIFSVTSKLKEGTYISVQLPLQRNGLENGK